MSAATSGFPRVSALPRALPDEDPAAALNARAAAGLVAGSGLICLSVLEMILPAATPAAGHRRVQTMTATSTGNAALACICELCVIDGAADEAFACSIMPPAPTPTTTATAINNRRLATARL
jgi:hypothetical protein